MRNILAAASLTRFASVRCIWFVAFYVFAVETGECCAAPTAEELARLGKETQQRFVAGDTARWKAIHDTGRGVVIEIDILSARDRRRIDFTGTAGGEREELATIIERDGLWYVNEKGVRTKHFPYEAPLKLTPLYLYLARSELLMVTETEFGKLASEEGDVLTFHVPLLPEARKILQQAVTEMKKLSVVDPEQREEIATRLAEAQRQLDEGKIVKIDARTGILVQAGEADKLVKIADFAWLDQPFETELAVDQVAWQDETTPLAPPGSQEVAMLGHSAMWRPGQPVADTDAMLINLRTGKFRRVATPYSAPTGGCFSPDHTKAYISAYDSASGAMVIGETDLAKHTFRVFSGNPSVGINLFPCVSPSGNSLIWQHKSGDEPGALMSRIGLLDLRTGGSKFIGEPMDTAFLSWLPDASAMILVHREAPASTEQLQRSSIARMSSSGKVTILRPGNSPQVIQAAKRILFVDDDELWKTCALDGKDEKLVGDGLKRFGTPSASPDGTQLLMSKFDKATGPRPYIIDIKTGRARQLRLPEGLWVRPIWH